MPLPRLLLLLIVLGLARPGAAQPSGGTFPIKGKVTDAKGDPLPFCNVYLKTTGQNTTANEQGTYQTVSLKPGTYEVLFQYVGYQPRTETVNINAQAVTLDVSLQENVYGIGEVTVRASDEDPAYAVVREAIARRKYHRDEIAAYRCQTYAKGMARLTDVPGKLLGGLLDIGPDIKPGIIYLSESVSELIYRQPGKVQERMISSRVSGRTKGMSFNRAAGLNFDFYENLVKTGFSERGVVSPLANGAMTFYRYHMVGATPGEGGKLINKIEVTPRHRRDPAFRGFIYIQDDTWRLTGVDLRLDKDAGIEYVDEIRVEQVLAPVGPGGRVWRPLSQKIRVEGEAFGFKGFGTFTTVYSQYEVRPAYPAEIPITSQLPVSSDNDQPVIRNDKPVTGNEKRVKPRRVKRPVKPDEAARDSLFVGEIPLRKGEVMRVEQDANQRDSTYWASVRPIPLTTEEKRDYTVKDSVESIKNSRPYQDSLDRVRNKPSVADILLGGYEYQRTFLKRTFSVPPIFRMLQYNTVEGTVLNAPITYRQGFEDRRYWQAQTTLRYGIADKNLKAAGNLQYRYSPNRESRVGLEGGRTIEDLNITTPLAPFVNSVYTLLVNDNYLKLYQRDYVAARWQSEVINGLLISTLAGYYDRRELFNTTDKIWRDQANRALTPNNPFSDTAPGDRAAYFGQTGARLFERSRIEYGSLLVRWQPGQEFIQRPNRKLNLGSSYPAFTFRARGGRGDHGTRFASLSLLADYSVDVGLVGESQLRLEAGFFPLRRNVPFVDYQHFRGNQVVLASSFDAGFQLLPYYQYSTTAHWLEGHVNHHFNGFFFNKVPALRKLKWQEVATANYLYTPQLGHYLEVGVGIEHLLKYLRVDAYASYRLADGQKGKSNSGLRIGLGF